MKRRQYPFIGILVAALLVVLGSAGAATVADGYRLDTVVAPSLFQGIHGMKVGPDGKLYVADIYGFTIWRVDIATGAAEPFVGFPNGMADDLAFGPDGTMAWTSPGAVFARAPNGAIREVAGNLPGVNGIGFSHSGRLFATQISGAPGGANTLVELDPAGTRPPKLLLENTGGINGFRIDANDVLWGPQGWLAGGYGNIVRIDLKTLKLSVVARGFTTPTGVDIDSKGNLYVVDLLDGTLTRVNPGTGAKTLVKQLDPWLDNLTIAPDDKIYISDTADNTIWEVDPRTATTRAVRRGDLALPGGVALVPGQQGDTIYVADHFSYKAIDAKTGRVTESGHRFGKKLVAGTSIRYAEGKLFLSDIHGGALSVLDPGTHEVVRTVHDLAGPQDAIALPNGDILVLEYDTGRLLRIAPNDSRRIMADGFHGPVGLVRKDDALYVTDAIAGTVVKIDLKTGGKTEIAHGFSQPEGIDLGPDGMLYVVEGNGGSVVRVNPATGARATIASGLPVGIVPPPGLKERTAHEPTIQMLRFPIWVPNGIAAARDGSLYVTADKVGALYRLTPVGAANNQAK
jgi:sugar lactone lactonase YvrE